MIAKRPLLSSQRYEFSVQFFWKEDGGSKSVRMIGIISEEMKKKKKGFYESLGSSSQSYGFTSEGRKTNWFLNTIFKLNSNERRKKSEFISTKKKV